jgi:hypothetical protein
MNHLRLVLSVVSMGSLMFFGGCGMAPMASTSTMLTARLSGATEVPAVMTDASGFVEASLLLGTNVLTAASVAGEEDPDAALDMLDLRAVGPERCCPWPKPRTV